jgi:ATP-dependent helicase HrpB
VSESRASVLLTPLPVDRLREPLHAVGARRGCFVLSAPTGSGKSTRVARYLLESGLDGQIWVLQPRRLATRVLARRVAAELGGSLGGTCGYAVRFERRAGPDTRILFVTEGLLLRRLLEDPTLRGIGALVFDEFHERHLDTDLGLALAVRTRQQYRPDLVIGVMSATLDVEVARRAVPTAEVLAADGRSWPVTIEYAAGVADQRVWDLAAQTWRTAARGGYAGDCLIFMPGSYEIRRTIDALLALPEARGRDILPLHGELPVEAQDAALEDGARPKVIVATNVAETSLTIPGVRLVIDSGLARFPEFDAQRGINTLLVQKISQASAGQRAGRAGRVAAGHCIRLWPERDHAWRPLHTAAEIRRVELSGSVLQLRCAGIDDVTALPWVEEPPADHWQRAHQLLADLGAVDAAQQPTAIGRAMARLPVHPRYARILVAARDLGMVDAVALAVALSEVRPIVLPLDDRRLADQREDQLLDEHTQHSDLLYAVRAWQWAAAHDFEDGFCRKWGIHRQAALEAGRIARQLHAVATDGSAPGGQQTADPAQVATGVRQCLLYGFADHLALRCDRATLRCDLVHGRRGEIARESVVQTAPLLVAAEIEERTVRGDVTVMLRRNTAVDEAWLRAAYPADWSERVLTRLDAQTRRVEGVRQTCFRDLVIGSKADAEPDPEAAARLLADAVEQGTMPLKEWGETEENWIRRVNCLARRCPELGIAPIGAAERRVIIEQLVHGARSYREIKELPVMPVLHDWLPVGLLALVDAWVPDRFALPNGKSVKLRYEEDGSVVLPAILQQLYDVPGKSLCVADGRIPLKIEILAPSRRPVQMTADLDAFWTSSYPAVKKDLRGRYPKHEWR